MAHLEQKQFCIKIKTSLPGYFNNKTVLDIGSLDINGSNRFLFDDCSYYGIDIGEGPNVDFVSKAHEFNPPDETYDTIISTECFEHDMYYDLSLKNIIRMLKRDGLFLFTCATDGRAEHGTTRTSPADAPLLASYEGWSDYYKNLTEQDIRNVLDIDSLFKEYDFEVNQMSHDLYFWGIKK